MTPASSKHVVILGAGIAGLAAAASLAARNIRYTILERGARAFSALYQIDPDMRMLSPRSVSTLPGFKAQASDGSYITFKRFIQSLREFQSNNNIRVFTGTDVHDVTHDGTAFHISAHSVDGSPASYSGTHVINATGMISTPFLPANFVPADVSFRWKHSINVRGDDLRDAARLVVVGGGASAGEILEQWLRLRSPRDRTWLSLVRKFFHLAGRRFGIDIHYLIWLPEHLPTRYFGNTLASFRDPMNGDNIVAAIRDGLITQVPEVKQFTGDRVVFANDVRINPDFVVFATGFRYGSEHLGSLVHHDANGLPQVRSCQSVAMPRLYLLGLRFGRTFASQYVRGIRRDAEYVAKKIARDSVV